MFQAEDDAALGFVLGVGGEEALDGGVDVAAVGEDLVEGWAGEGGAEFLFGHLAEGAVVGVEEPVEVGVEGLVAGDELGEDEGFEEPGGVGEMPLDGRGFGAGLDHHVFGGERGAEGHGGGAHGAEAVEQGGGAGVLGGEMGRLHQHGALQFRFDAYGAWMLHEVGVVVRKEGVRRAVAALWFDGKPMGREKQWAGPGEMVRIFGEGRVFRAAIPSLRV